MSYAERDYNREPVTEAEAKSDEAKAAAAESNAAEIQFLKKLQIAVAGFKTRTGKGPDTICVNPETPILPGRFRTAEKIASLTVFRHPQFPLDQLHLRIGTPNEEEIQTTLQRAFELQKECGPTGAHRASGPIGPNDEGGAVVNVGTNPEHKLVILDFGTPMRSIGMTAEQTVRIAEMMIQAALTVHDGAPLAIQLPTASNRKPKKPLAEAD